MSWIERMLWIFWRYSCGIPQKQMTVLIDMSDKVPLHSHCYQVNDWQKNNFVNKKWLAFLYWVEIFHFFNEMRVSWYLAAVTPSIKPPSPAHSFFSAIKYYSILLIELGFQLPNWVCPNVHGGNNCAAMQVRRANFCTLLLAGVYRSIIISRKLQLSRITSASENIYPDIVLTNKTF